ncbi:coiled-coil alpha-helical rod protein 1 [Sphaerodactylus townsendi]|uniref:coiled-coil alpha-helical rod protein 1 n=1 Tax=Sphaerodactylus townsendi TaxID=933632 RepID=UPI0020269B39|nr:coiled-coil alpha-helical rod protein 1 [Sphaerodactylus townsendi]XP_048338685.1 coiled-coil alpha-helical rod protein 1 [Sphaerodactylus townsendi]XP_048338686.1 coiled-coil alpha-helical rod protein 1 [Sphaerodactylus townsendi]XP_048338687.1 coiled-coil alpha-helical rod protein 1 [Sphaerodactylus townsendi]XP_048338688.1 coiled-coil alpha-helical rod protein 1 [Sphaerodactylus townsendi]XP_048338690.1 coiled-coil alpha-helical rod protein 1 [Sphaerodactylus townsendi]XP_048338691.1 co
MDRRRYLSRQLDPPAAFRAPRPGGPKGLIPPSHFQSRSAPPLTAPAAAPLSAATLPNWEALELRQENQRLKDELCRRAPTGDVASGGRVADHTEDAGSRTRSLDREAEPPNMRHALAMSHQAEIISHQLHEIQRLEAELAALRVASLQHEVTAASRENTLSHLQGELAELRRQSQMESAALKAELEEVSRSRKLDLEALKEKLDQLRSQTGLEADGLREELELVKERCTREIGLAQGELQRVLEEAEAERKRQEERAQECLQTVLKEHEAELSRLSEGHNAEVSSLKHQAQALQKDLEAQQKEATQLREERDVIQNELSGSRAELASQNALLMQLKTYVGEQESRKPCPEQEQLISRVHHLEEEKEALKTTAELQQVRLASLSDILTLQETELARKAPLKDPLQTESSQKLQCLLSRWREKVFSLLVQLKCQELCHVDTTRLLQRKVKELEDDVESKDQKVTVLLHSLEDRTAEADMERVRNKTLMTDASHYKELAQKLQQRAEAGENALQGLVEVVSRLHQQLTDQEKAWKAVLSRLLGLGNRISFAAKRVDTIQGLVCQKIALAKLQQGEKLGPPGPDQDRLHPPYEDMQTELQMLHEERDRLSTELKRGAQLIEKKLAEVQDKAESDLMEMRETVQHLQGVLEAKVVMEQSLRQQQEALERQLEEARSNLRKAEEAAESSRQELGQLREEYEKALQEKVVEVETQLRQDLSEMGKKLNEAQREHTKAVVALRQVERQAARDKARREEMAKLQDAATQQETARLEARLRELERDKNLLMATLRQEGMLTQCRQNRRAAVQASAELTEKGAAQTPSKESLSAVLSDLQVLSAAILDEEAAEEKLDEDGSSDGDA